MSNVWNNKADISWIDTKKPMVALSFDDGPVDPMNDSSSAIRIQNALRDNGMHATFFYWGSTLNDGTIKEIERAYELGFEIANHTWNHLSLPTLSKEEIEREVSSIGEVLEKITGEEKLLFRPPFIDINPLVLETVKAPFITCGLDTKDYTGISSDEIISIVKNAMDIGELENKIVLMHENIEETAKAVEYLVPFLKDKGYQVVNISEMFKVLGKDMYDGKIYTCC